MSGGKVYLRCPKCGKKGYHLAFGYGGTLLPDRVVHECRYCGHRDVRLPQEEEKKNERP